MLPSTLTRTQANTVLSCSQEQEISWIKLIMAPSVCAAHTDPTRHAASQEVTLILQKHTQSQPDAQVDALQSKHAQARTRMSISCTGKCLRWEVRRAHVFAGARGPATHSRYVHVVVLFAPRVSAHVRLPVCQQASIYPASSKCGVYPEPHIIEGKVSPSAVLYYCMD